MSLTVVTRSLTTQTNGSQAGSASGGFDRRPYGPSLAGWPVGYSGSNTYLNDINNTAVCSEQLALPANSNTGYAFAWFFFGNSVGDANTLQILAFIGASAYFIYELHVHPDTLQVDLLAPTAGIGAAQQLNIGTVPRKTSVALWIAAFRTGQNQVLTFRVYKKLIGQAPVQLGVDATCNIVNDYLTHVRVGTFKAAGNPRLPARIGLPSLYTMDVLADAGTYPSEVLEPETSRSWWVRNGASGGGNGSSFNDGFNPAEFVTAAGELFTILPGECRDPTNGTIIDTTVNDATVLADRYEAGTASPYGDIVYFANDVSGPIRFATTLTFATCDNVRLLPAVGYTNVEIRGTTVLNSWNLDSGNIYKAVPTVQNAYGVVFAWSGIFGGDSPTARPIILTHPTAADIAAYRLAATPNSFWTTGGGGTGVDIYVQTATGFAPIVDGRQYEISTANNIIVFTCSGALVKGLIVRMGMAVDNTNSGASLADGYCIKISGSGMTVIDPTVRTELGGKHCVGIIAPANLNKMRTIIYGDHNNGRPIEYCGVGGQSVLVNFGQTTGMDNQWVYRNVTVTTNSAVVGSTTVTVDPNQSSILEHNTGDSAIAFSKGEVRGCRIIGQIGVGSVTGASSVYDNEFGSNVTNIRNGFGCSFGASTCLVTRNRISGMGLPILNGVILVHNNIFTTNVALGTPNAWTGTITFVGNTVDASLATGTAGESLATRGTTATTINFGGNVVLFNNSQAYRLFATITPASGDVLNMDDNEFQGNDVNRILITSYAGATKTLAQIVAGGQDTGSEWQVDLKITGPAYGMASGSAAKGTVALAGVPALASTKDFNKTLRGASGNTDAGAVLASAGVGMFKGIIGGGIF